MGFYRPAEEGKMKVKLGLLAILVLISTLIWRIVTWRIDVGQQNSIKTMSEENEISLPEPKKQSQTSVEEAILKRRSVREYKDEPLSLKEVSQILWSAQGLTAPDWGGRAAPSAGALYPLEVYLVASKVENLTPGVYHFIPQGHKLKRVKESDLSLVLTQSALDQGAVKNAPISLVLTAVFERTTQKYGQRGERYVYMEVGHAAQNVYLQAQSLALGTVVIGAFDDQALSELLNLSSQETPLYIVPVGRER